ncbi:MAG: DUF4331 family protein [Actinomycetota bacterium]|nr:DUF4331 family protein [Actinomycetota bacterium]
MSNNITGLSLGAPRGDARLDLRDLYVFQSPHDPTRTALILTANPSGDAMHPDAVYRIAIDNDGDLRNDIAFNFVFSEPLDGPDGPRQKVDVYLALAGTSRVDAAAGSRIFGDVEVSFDGTPHVWRSGSFTFFAGIRSDPAFLDLDGITSLFGGNGRDPWTGTDSRAGANVMAMAVELPTSYLGAHPDVRVWGRCSLLRDGAWLHADRVAQPLISSFFSTGTQPQAFAAGEPNRDRDRWIGPLIELMGETGGYTRDEAIEAINTEGTLPDMLVYNPSAPARYPNGRSLTDDVIDYRLAFLTKGQCPPSGLTPHDDLLLDFPYLGTPH